MPFVSFAKCCSLLFTKKRSGKGSAAGQMAGEWVDGGLVGEAVIGRGDAWTPPGQRGDWVQGCVNRGRQPMPAGFHQVSSIKRLVTIKITFRASKEVCVSAPHRYVSPPCSASANHLPLNSIWPARAITEKSTASL